MKKQGLQKGTLQSQSGKNPKRKNKSQNARKIKKNRARNLHPEIKKFSKRYVKKRRLKGSNLKDKRQSKTKGKQKKQQSLLEIDTFQIGKLVHQGNQIKKTLNNKNSKNNKNKIFKYMEEVKKLFGMKLFEQQFEALDFNSLWQKLKNLHYQKLENQNLELKDENLGLKGQNMELKKNQAATKYYEKRKQMTLKEYKSLIQSYRQNGNVVKAHYHQIDSEQLFKWVQEQNAAYQQLRQAKIKQLKQNYKQSKEKRKISDQLKLLKEEGPYLFNEYVKDINDLLQGGLLIEVQQEDNLRLLADLLSYGFRLRHKAFIKSLESKVFSTSFISIEQKKNFRQYSQATIKTSSFANMKEYYNAAREVMQSVRKSPKLLFCLTQFLNSYCALVMDSSELFEVQDIQKQFENKIQFDFFDYDFPISGISFWRDNQLKIYYNTFYDYNEKKEITANKINLFKTFIFYTYLHELAHFLIRSLEVCENQEASQNSQDIDQEKNSQFQNFLKITGKNRKKKQMQQSGRKLEMYLFGKVIDYLFEDQFDNFLQAQKQENLDIRKYFRKQEKLKKNRKEYLQRSPLMLHRTFRHNLQQSSIREIPGTKLLSRAKPKTIYKT